ncbi:MAG: hypothetical protein AABM30_12705 [Actinomycetota bacterium]
MGSKILRHKLAVQLGREAAQGKEMPVSSGVMYALLEGTGVLNARMAQWARTSQGRQALRAAGHNSGISDNKTEGCQNVFHGHGQKNTRVNQDCSFRRQAEEMIQINPLNENNIIAGQNDSRIGYNHCGYDWSFDGGKNWGDQVPPFWQFVLLDGHTADACSDPTGTWDSHANAYAGGILFDINSGANAVVVMKSNAGNGGAFYHDPGPTGVPGGPAFQEYRTNHPGVVANDDGDVFFNDKELMTADAHPSSPKRDNVYMTWTRFTADNHSPIYFGQSTDGGATWSAPVEISGSSASLCPLPAGICNDNQGSDPVVGPDGTIYVAFANGNIPGAGIEQVLMVKCPASANCSNAASWTPPTKVGDMISTHPVGGASQNGCPNRQCLPPSGYRVPDETTVTISVDRNSKLYTTWADHRNNTNPACQLGAPGGGAPPCDHDIHYAFSTNMGATWSATRTITPRSQFGETAQWQSWSEVTTDGSRLWVAYYDRHYGNCESTGCNDITAAEIRNPASAHPSYDYERVTTGSMPNLTPANNPVQAGFLGDYMWVDTDSHGDAHIVWADTRPIRGTAPEEDVYYAEVHRNSGH